MLTVTVGLEVSGKRRTLSPLSSLYSVMPSTEATFVWEYARAPRTAAARISLIDTRLPSLDWLISTLLDGALGKLFAPLAGEEAWVWCGQNGGSLFQKPWVRMKEPRFEG